LWWDSSNAKPYIYYNDGNSNQWTSFSPLGGVGPVGPAGPGVAIQETAPSSPSAGDLWFDSSNLKTFIYYNDGNSNQWVRLTQDL
jgi:hypothetical protein